MMGWVCVNYERSSLLAISGSVTGRVIIRNDIKHSRRTGSRGRGPYMNHYTKHESDLSVLRCIIIAMVTFRNVVSSNNSLRAEQSAP